MPLGKLPVLEIDGVKHTHSIAILRYLGEKFNIFGSDDLEKFHIDGVGMGVYDLLGSE